MVQGDICGGRSDLDKQKLLAEITKACVKGAEINEYELIVVIHDTPAKFIMDGGRFSPEPGQEAEWFAKAKAQAG
jgi:phenylpyruvate tautomerase PptA (4-oxalocrotonate tautomerase family)